MLRVTPPWYQGPYDYTAPIKSEQVLGGQGLQDPTQEPRLQDTDPPDLDFLAILDDDRSLLPLSGDQALLSLRLYQGACNTTGTRSL